VEKSNEKLDRMSSSSASVAMLLGDGEMVDKSSVKGVSPKLEEGTSLEGDEVVKTCNASCAKMIMREPVPKSLKTYLQASYARRLGMGPWKRR
jgi:hypothetical protein